MSKGLVLYPWKSSRVTRHDKILYHARMSALAKLIRLQPRSSLSSFRLQTSRTLSLAARLHRPSLTQVVSSSWSPVSVRYFSTEPEGNDKSQKEKAQPPKRLFVFNVPYDAQNEHLREIFSPYGAIDRVYLCTCTFFKLAC